MTFGVLIKYMFRDIISKIKQYDDAPQGIKMLWRISMVLLTFLQLGNGGRFAGFAKGYHNNTLRILQGVPIRFVYLLRLMSP